MKARGGRAQYGPKVALPVLGSQICTMVSLLKLVEM